MPFIDMTYINLCFAYRYAMKDPWFAYACGRYAAYRDYAHKHFHHF